MVRGEIVYATPALEKTRRVPTTFNIGHRWPELDTDHLLRHGLPPAVQQKVIYLSRRIASHFPRCRHDEQDLIQDFTLEVVKAMIKFDWAKGKPVAFMRGVLDNAYMDKLRRLNNPSWYPAGLQQFDHHEHGLTACTGRHNDHTHEFMIAEDFQAAIYKLPPERKHLVELLQHTSTPKAAERLGIHRGTAYAWRTKLQEEFGDKLRDFL